MSQDRKEIAARHQAVAANFSRKVDAVTDWNVPTPVAGWSARDVVVHLVEWSRGLFGSAEGVSFGDIADPRTDPAGAWHTHVEQMQTLLDNPKLDQAILTNPHFGQQPLADAIGTYYVPDIFMHTWDLATATGQEPGLDQATCAAMLAGMEQMEDQLRAGGQFGTRQSVKDGATSEERLIAFIGRDPYWVRPAATAR